MIIGCIIFFNEREFLEASLKALKSQTDMLVVVDGAYEDFPHERPYSTDGSLEIAEAYADFMVSVQKPWKTQQDKRNQYFIGKEGDYYLIIDADEILEGKIPELSQDDYKIMLHRIDNTGTYPVYRIIKHRRGLIYWGTHHGIWIDGELRKPRMLLNKREMPTLEGCSILHKSTLQSKKRIEIKNEYYRIRRPKEEVIRKICDI